MLRIISAACILFVVNNCCAISVGDSYGGGTVFCVSKTQEDIKTCDTKTGAPGNYALIMANVDQANLDSPNHGMKWSDEYSVTNAQHNNGAINTDLIIENLPSDNPNNNAAHLCRNYRDSENHTDWYLPSKDELNKMYTYIKDNDLDLIGKNCAGSKANGIQCLIGGGKCATYWSSTERSDYSAWSQYFSNGIQDSDRATKGAYFGVRAIRFFNPLPPKLFLKNIEISFNNLNIIKGFMQQLTATGKYNNGVEKNITNEVIWKSSDNKIIKFDPVNPGLAMALKAGIVEITVTVKEDGKKVLSQSQVLTVDDTNVLRDIRDINRLVELAARPEISLETLEMIMQNPIIDADVDGINILKAVFDNPKAADRDMLLAITSHAACDLELSRKVFAHPKIMINIHALDDVIHALDNAITKRDETVARFDAQYHAALDNAVAQHNADIKQRDEAVEQQRNKDAQMFADSIRKFIKYEQ